MKIKKFFLSFWSFVIYFLIIFAAATVVLMNMLDDYLDEYEFYQPTTLSDEVLGYFRELDTESLENLPCSGEKLTGDNFSEYLSAICDSSSLFCYKSSTGESSLTYDYISKNKKIASLVLKKSGELSKNKLDIYEIDDIVWYPQFSYTVTVPDDCKVYLNGILLEGEGEIVGTDESYTEFDGYTASTYRYTIDDLTYITDVKAESMNSAEVTVEEIRRDDGADFVVKREMNEEMKGEIDARTREAVVAYVYYTTLNSYHVSTVLPYIYPASPLYNDLKNFNNTWNHSRISDEFTKFDVTDFVYHDDTHASCRADVIYKITKYGNRTEEFDFYFDLYYVKEDGEWYLTLMERVIE